MPIFLRKYYIHKVSDIIKKENDEIEKAKNKSPKRK